jgi:hypothetical protein
LVRALPCHGRGCGFEPRRLREVSHYTFTAFGRSNLSFHVYELRMYHVNEGKAEAIVARFRDQTDELFKRHNIKSVGYGVPEADRLLGASIED